MFLQPENCVEDKYSNSFGNNHVLKSLTFDVMESEVLGVIGPNGAGKTVMLNMLTGILKPTKGEIYFRGENIIHLTITERCKKGFGRTFQVPRPFEKMTVFENIIVGGAYGDQKSEKVAKLKALEISEMIGLAERILGRFNRRANVIQITSVTLDLTIWQKTVVYTGLR